MGGIVLLWIIIALFLVSAIGVGVYFTVKHFQSSGSGQFPGNPCSEDINALPDVSSLSCCVGEQGTNTNLKYSPIVDMVLAPFPSSYLDVCVGFCDKTPLGPNETCEGSPPSVTQFNNCIALLQPKTCEGEALPIGIDGTTLYYGYLATQSTCTSCCVCGSSSICTPTPCTPNT